jgi:hypothetical protein
MLFGVCRMVSVDMAPIRRWPSGGDGLRHEALPARTGRDVGRGVREGVATGRVSRQDESRRCSVGPAWTVRAQFAVDAVVQHRPCMLDRTDFPVADRVLGADRR